MKHPVTYPPKSDSVGNWKYSYDTFLVIEAYPHTSDFVEDQTICDEFGLEMTPVHCERWRDKRIQIHNYDTNVASLKEGEEILSYLTRHTSISDSAMESLIIAAIKRLSDRVSEDDSLDVDVNRIENLATNLIRWNDGCDGCPESVTGITDANHYGGSRGDNWGIFPTKYSPLPSIGTCKAEQLGYGSGMMIPTNTPLSEATIKSSTRVSLDDVRNRRNRWF